MEESLKMFIWIKNFFPNKKKRMDLRKQEKILMSNTRREQAGTWDTIWKTNLVLVNTLETKINKKKDWNNTKRILRKDVIQILVDSKLNNPIWTEYMLHTIYSHVKK